MTAKQVLGSFMHAFPIRAVSQMITLGGDAELELVDSLDPFSEGIVFSVRPPKKSWKNISNLSGGEKVRLGLCQRPWLCNPRCESVCVPFYGPL
jgi:hypothetical protein